MNLNNKLDKIYSKFFEDMNSFCFATETKGSLFLVETPKVTDLYINILSIHSEGSEIRPSFYGMSQKLYYPTRPLVRFKFTYETAMDLEKDEQYFKQVVGAILNDVKPAWETRFGKYTQVRYGDNFFKAEFKVVSNDDVIFDITGCWASGEEAR